MGKTGQKGQGNAGGWPSTKSGIKSGSGRSNNTSGGGKSSGSSKGGGKK
ncbi:MAG: hypothetical protein JXR71_01530 [Bacteroidales bacterium]|nr:hypothetical protein [Bacteroidales bacterium]